MEAAIVPNCGHSVNQRGERGRYFLTAGARNKEQTGVVNKLKKNEDATLDGRIRMAMAAVGISTAAELARRMKVSRQTVHNYLSGQRDKPEPELLFRMSDVLNISAKWLALGAPHSPIKPVMMPPEDLEVLQIAKNLDGEAREQWLSSGRTMVRLTTKAGPSNPFGVKTRVR